MRRGGRFGVGSGMEFDPKLWHVGGLKWDAALKLLHNAMGPLPHSSFRKVWATDQELLHNAMGPLPHSSFRKVWAATRLCVGSRETA